MNKEKKTTAWSCRAIWITAYFSDVCGKHCANYYCGKRLQIIKWADCYVDSECYADCRNRYVDTVVSNLACWFGAADCNGN